ncbi:MAG TPA: hypothetical protein DIW44_13280 [Anaerolineaceae bacterium]|nr:hypothetical protein [Anaerolineaceae bacterium]
MVTKKMFQANRDSTIRMKALLQDLSDQQLLSVMPNGWSVSVTLAHLAFWDNRVIHLIESSKKEGKVNPSNFEDSINDIMEPFLRAIPAAEAAAMAVRNAETLDLMLEECSDELLNQLDVVNHRWVDRSLHRNSHLDEIEALLKTAD